MVAENTAAQAVLQPLWCCLLPPGTAVNTCLPVRLGPPGLASEGAGQGGAGLLP